LKNAIVGAGIAGLCTAYQLSKKNFDLVVFEKSKGVGGRMATKRIGSEKFDHGAQFYSENSEMSLLHHIWTEANLVTYWFTKNEISRYRSNSGITALAKKIAQNLTVHLNKKLISIEKLKLNYVLKFDDDSRFETERLILAAPLPQSLELLRSSQLSYPSELETILYAKALVLLIEDITANSTLMGESGYSENTTNEVFSIADQHKKNNCQKESWVITMSTEFSEAYFDETDQKIIDLALAKIKLIVPDLKFENISLKKWRYSHPKNTHSHLFLKLDHENIFLIGDAFGGPSVSGAVRSANALVQNFLRQ
jgi:renalase